jgi:hypothetical protein
MCGAHRQRMLKHGDPQAHIPIADKRPQRLSPVDVFRLHMPGDPPEAECWLWTGRRNEGGYGVIECQLGKVRFRARAHRVSYALFVGVIPPGLILRHSCDNPPCCNPQHLLIGTRTDNSLDKVSRDRQSRGEAHALKTRGEDHYKARLTEADVLAIRSHAARGELHWFLADEYGVAKSHISNIVTRRTWKHI